jgi:hypothetical protein
MTTLYFHWSRWPPGLRPIACWDCGFESCRRYACPLRMFSVFRLTPLQRAYFSSRGGLPSVHHCLWQSKRATLYARNDQAGRGQTKTKFILHFHSYTLSTNCCLIKRKGQIISVPSLFSESSYHTLCALNRRHRKNAKSYYYVLVMFVRLFPYGTPRLPLD